MKTKLITLLTLLLTVCSGAWADNTLFNVDFTDEESETIETTESSAIFVAKNYDGYSMSMGIKKSKPINIIKGSGLEFTSNNYNSYTCLAIPLTLTANNKVTVSITLHASGKVKYGWVKGSLPTTPNAGSGTAYSTAGTTNTLEYTPTEAGSYVLYLGRNGSSDGKVIEKIVITQVVSATNPYSVTFDAGINGTCATKSLTEASVSAGITLPSVTPNSGYAFNGWYTAASEGIKAGNAGDTYYPTANVTLYAQYSEESAPGISIDNYTPSTMKGTEVTFTATATGAPTPTVTWYQNETATTSGGTSKGTGTTYKPDVTEEGTFYYYAVASNGISPDATSELITLTVTNPDVVVSGNNYYVAKGDTKVNGAKILCDDITMEFVTSGSFNTADNDAMITSLNANYVAAIASGANGWGVEFTPSASGVLSVGIVINSGKSFSVTNVESFYSVDKDGNKASNESGSWTPSSKFYGIISIGVTAGTKYKFSVSGSKMSLYGFEFHKTTTNSLNSKGYATYSNSYDVVVSGAKAYTATLDMDGGVITCTEIADGKVPAGAGVLIYQNGGGEVTLTPTYGVAALSSNNLKGTTKADGTLVAKGENTYYALSGDTFMPFTGSTFTANKAYFEVASDIVQVREFSIVFEDSETTGINNIEGSMQNTEGYYNLNGQRVAAPAKGLYIVNGKKVVIR